MTDFVLNINELVPKESDQFFQSWQNKKMMIIENYARFLKEPLRIEMFFVCDEQGNKLEVPKNYLIWLLRRNEVGFKLPYNEKYYRESQKVLFKNCFEEESVAFINGIIYRETVESCLILDGSIELTDSAIKRIFG